MMRIRLAGPAVCLICGAAAALAQESRQDPFANVEIKATHVAGKVYMLEGAGGNIGVSVGDDGVLLVDTQYAPLADKIRAAVGKLGDGKIRYVINTHYHFDHTDGNPAFGPEATIIAHRNVRKRVLTPQRLLGRMTEPLPKEGLPVIVFDDSLSVHFNGEELRVVHSPNAHTDGDSVIFFTESNVVHMGDLLFAGMFPFVDVDNGGNVVGLIESYDELLSEIPKDAKIIPGHGPLSTWEDVKTYREMLAGTTDYVRGQMKAGKALAEIKAGGLPAKWQSWARGFITEERWIELAYKSLAQKPRGEAGTQESEDE